MHGHLIAVKVGVEGLAHQRMELYRASLDEHGLECLDAEAVQSRSTIQQDGMIANNLFENIPDFGPNAFNHALCASDVMGEIALDQLPHHKRLQEPDCHALGQTAL